MSPTALLDTEIVPESEAAIKARLVEIQAELDEIGVTFGMNQRRMALRNERDELLDKLSLIFKSR